MNRRRGRRERRAQASQEPLTSPHMRDDLRSMRELAHALLDGDIPRANTITAAFDRRADPGRFGMSETTSVLGLLFATATAAYPDPDEARAVFDRMVDESLRISAQLESL